MKEIIEWLKHIEQLAHTLYDQAGERFSNGSPMHRFLRNMAEEEANHYHIMGNAAEIVSSKKIRRSGIEIDTVIKERVEAPFQKLLQALSNESISENQIFDFVIETEFSEWNDIFLYVVNTLKVEDKTFSYAADRIQEHLQHIEGFFNNFPYGRERLDQLKSLPAFWKGTILIVDDEEAIVTLLSDLLDETFRTDVAHNGKDALALLKRNEYDVVLSDIDMPGLSGIELYQQATSFNQHLGRKFIFYTAGLSAKNQDFIRENNLRFILKPSSILKIEDIIAETLKQNKTDHV